MAKQAARLETLSAGGAYQPDAWRYCFIRDIADVTVVVSCFDIGGATVYEGSFVVSSTARSLQAFLAGNWNDSIVGFHVVSMTGGHMYYNTSGAADLAQNANGIDPARAAPTSATSWKLLSTSAPLTFGRKPM